MNTDSETPCARQFLNTKHEKQQGSVRNKAYKRLESKLLRALFRMKN